MSFNPTGVASYFSPPTFSPERRAPVRRQAERPPLIAICHLSWNWVWQRPQQFLSRLSEGRLLLFVETYCSEVTKSFTRTRVAPAHSSVTILEIHLPAGRWSDGAFIDAERRRVLQNRLAGEFLGKFDDAILWFNDPMAVTAYAGHLGERIIVYDCMDELSLFRGASPGMVEREHELTLKADLIFCGGRKMRDKRLPLNANTHFYGTGVDCAHFGAALSPDLPVDPQIAAMKGPVLGYFGVIDERIDYDLLAELADACPTFHIAMVGPFAKIDPAALPRRSNLHWLGGRPYAQLPALTKGFSACLMPFALNAATAYINPTKALEYMAAARPVVSTALDEVRTNFAGVARIARDRAHFIALCQREVSSPSRARIERGIALAKENTWEAITAKMEAHMDDVLLPAAAPVPKASARRSAAPDFAASATYV